MTWMTGSYDPALDLVYWGTGNPNPVLAGEGREGDNLYTCSIVALHGDTGKLAWYYQPSPHDVHDWDAVETPILFDGEFHGAPRQMLAQASRNGYFFLLDRKTGAHLLTAPFVESNWAQGIDAAGQARKWNPSEVIRRAGRGAGRAGIERVDELAFAELRSADGFGLCQRAAAVEHLL